MSEYQRFIHISRYARWRDEEGRRETWNESVDRYVDFMAGHLKEHMGYEVPAGELSAAREVILAQEALPSMRALMTAGPALERNSIASFNCSYMPVDSVRAFDEMLYILMNGTGVGYSVERDYIKQLPVVAEQFERSSTVITVGDSKEGWAKAFRELLALLWAGQIPTWDMSQVRKAGARLKTFGGRASGPGPLEDLFAFSTDLLQRAAGRRLTTLEAHDLVCKIASVVVVGGVRRAALISLSDLSDGRMAAAKSGDWYTSNAHRGLANNSVAYTIKPDVGSFLAEWLNLYNSKSGERGVFNRVASRKQAAKNGRRDPEHAWGTNPCSEIILRPYQMCNLSTVVVRDDDTEETLTEKIRIAATLGTWQSTLTRFKYLRAIWRKNTEEERLLGVSMTGQLAHPLLNGRGPGGLKATGELLERLRTVAVETNAKVAAAIGIPQATAVTAVKPEGTSSQLVNAASGMHAWHSPYYIRTVRASKLDPLAKFMAEAGIPHEDDVREPDQTWVFSFPVKAPEGAITRDDLTAIEHLELWLTYQRHWCEHKPSVTITVREHEWPAVGSWVWEHFDEISGVSFLPHSEHIYKQAPYQEITKDQYDAAVAAMPKGVRWADLGFYESTDSTTGSQELACSADGGAGCEVVDLVSTGP